MYVHIHISNSTCFTRRRQELHRFTICFRFDLEQTCFVFSELFSSGIEYFNIFYCFTKISFDLNQVVCGIFNSIVLLSQYLVTLMHQSNVLPFFTDRGIILFVFKSALRRTDLSKINLLINICLVQAGWWSRFVVAS